MQITKESLPMFHAGQGTVGAAEVPLSTVNVPVFQYFTVKAARDNNNWLLVGPRGSAAANGFPLLAGEETPPIYVDSTQKVGVIAGGANQSYSYILS